MTMNSRNSVLFVIHIKNNNAFKSLFNLKCIQKIKNLQNDIEIMTCKKHF